MFRCEVCRAVSEPGEKQFRVVVERRTHIFRFRADANVFRKHGETKLRDDKGGRGKQIVLELKVGACCLEQTRRLEALT